MCSRDCLFSSRFDEVSDELRVSCSFSEHGRTLRLDNLVGDLLDNLVDNLVDNLFGRACSDLDYMEKLDSLCALS